MVSAEVQAKAEQWLQWDKNPEDRAQIESLLKAGDEAELSKRLSTRIQFGTAGLRGPMKAGFSCMNDLTIIQASQGLAVYLEKVVDDAKNRGVAIGYDGRYHSKDFAHLTAATFLSRGFVVYLYSTIVATPLVPYCCSQKNCAAGVMVTASHNPKNDNGYKVYWETGCQIIPPHDEGIAAAIEENLVPWGVDINSAEGHPLRRDPLVELSEKYFKDIARDFCNHPEANAKSQHKIVFTAMHGVGAPWVAKSFEAFNLPPYIPVKEQINPDPEFPTVAFPNPEEGKGALTLAMKTADENGAKVIFANDPDADRLAVAEKQPNGEWRIFSGNELGSILGHWVWIHHLKRNPGFDRSKGLMIASTVSSKFLKGMAAKEGFRFDEALTGFKWIGHRGIDLEKEGYEYIFGFEEAIGFMIGKTCWDKDGVRTAAVFAEMYVHYADQGISIAQQLYNLYSTYGFYESKVHYYFCYDPNTMTKIFDRIRQDQKYPTSIGNGKYKIVGVRDLTTGYDTDQPDHKAVLPVSASSHMITFTFENGCSATLRGSGTEPKLKYYVELCGSDNPAAVRERLMDMVALIIEEFLEPEKNGLVKPRD